MLTRTNELIARNILVVIWPNRQSVFFYVVFTPLFLVDSCVWGPFSTNIFNNFFYPQFLLLVLKSARKNSKKTINHFCASDKKLYMAWLFNHLVRLCLCLSRVNDVCWCWRLFFATSAFRYLFKILETILYRNNIRTTKSRFSAIFIILPKFSTPVKIMSSRRALVQ